MTKKRKFSSGFAHLYGPPLPEIDLGAFPRCEHQIEVRFFAAWAHQTQIICKDRIAAVVSFFSNHLEELSSGIIEFLDCAFLLYLPVRSEIDDTGDFLTLGAGVCHQYIVIVGVVVDNAGTQVGQHG